MKHKIIEDPKYGYKRIDPIPTEEEVLKYYQEEFYSIDYGQLNDSSLKVQEEEKAFYESNWNRIIQFCEKEFNRINGLKLFDIGFGYAQALLYFKKHGMCVSGIEPCSEGVEHAKKQGIDGYQAGIEDFSIVEHRNYDIVTLLNVLEHLREPAKTLVNIRQEILAPKGIVVLDIPNEFNDFQVVANEEFSLAEWWVVPPNHINYFSCSTIVSLLEQTGYEVIEQFASFPLEMFLLFGDVYVRNSDIGKICHNKRVKFEHLMRKHGKTKELNNFYRMLAKLNLGRQTLVFARPI